MELMKLMGDTGARDLLRGARAVPTEALAFDVDTEEDVERARRLFEG
jgi:molybdenum cofactor cytidylyltransferase